MGVGVSCLAGVGGGAVTCVGVGVGVGGVGAGGVGAGSTFISTGVSVIGCVSTGSGTVWITAAAGALLPPVASSTIAITAIAISPPTIIRLRGSSFGSYGSLTLFSRHSRGAIGNAVCSRGYCCAITGMLSVGTRSGPDGGPVIVRATIGLAKGLRLKTIAEGVETRAEATFLRQHGCEVLQGFLFAEPMLPQAFAAFAETSHLRLLPRALSTSHG